MKANVLTDEARKFIAATIAHYVANTDMGDEHEKSAYRLMDMFRSPHVLFSVVVADDAIDLG